MIKACVFNVNLEPLLGKLELLDKREFMVVVASLFEDGTVRLAATPDTLLEIANASVYKVETGEEVSYEHVRKLIDNGKDAGITNDVRRDNSIVGIRLEKGKKMWQDDGVFYPVDGFTQEWKTNADVVRKNAKSCGIPAIGRAALMLRVLFAVAGIKDSINEPFFSLVDVWEGTGRIDAARLKDCVEFTDRPLQVTILNYLNMQKAPLKVKLRSIDLNNNNMSNYARAIRGKDFFRDIEDLVANRRRALGDVEEDSDDDDEGPSLAQDTNEEDDDESYTLLETIKCDSDIMFCKMHFLVVEAYKKHFKEQFDKAAKVIGPKPQDWPQAYWKYGIHGMYTKPSAQNLNTVEFSSLPWAVAGNMGVVDHCFK